MGISLSDTALCLISLIYFTYGFFPHFFLQVSDVFLTLRSLSHINFLCLPQQNARQKKKGFYDLSEL